jgi:hypothetical protein
MAWLDPRRTLRFVPTTANGFIDYAIAVAFLVLTPRLGFGAYGPSGWVGPIIGLVVLAYSLFTAYELGCWLAIPLPAHRALDAITGAALLAAPFALDFDRFVALYVTAGALQLAAALLTQPAPTRSYEERLAGGAQ